MPLVAREFIRRVRVLHVEGFDFMCKAFVALALAQDPDGSRFAPRCRGRNYGCQGYARPPPSVHGRGAIVASPATPRRCAPSRHPAARVAGRVPLQLQQTPDTRAELPVPNVQSAGEARELARTQRGKAACPPFSPSREAIAWLTRTAVRPRDRLARLAKRATGRPPGTPGS